MSSAKESKNISHIRYWRTILVLVAMSLLTITPLSSLGAVYSESGYVLQPPEVLWQEGQWIWRMPIVQYAIGITGGFFLSLMAITFLAWRVLTGGNRSFGDFLPILFRNPFLWGTATTMAAIAGLCTSGVFEFLRSQVWETFSTIDSLGLASIGPLVVTGLLAIISKRTTAWIETARNALTGEDEAINKLLNSARRFNWFSVLILDQYYTEQQERIAKLAVYHETGLIQRVVWQALDRRVDKGQMPPMQRDKLIAPLLRIATETDERAQFNSAKLALHASLSIASIEELERWLLKGERRSNVDRRQKATGIHNVQEMRKSDVRRTGTGWTPTGRQEEAA